MGAARLERGAAYRKRQKFRCSIHAVHLDLENDQQDNQHADEACFSAKDGGRNQVCFADSAQDVEDTVRFVANEHNIKNVGELPLSEQVTAMIGQDVRYLKIYMFCNPLTAVKMVDYSDAFSAYLPCRVTVVEDKTGKLWLYSLNMDMMIHGGTALPDELREEADDVKEIILDIMERGATGDF